MSWSVQTAGTIHLRWAAESTLLPFWWKVGAVFTSVGGQLFYGGWDQISLAWVIGVHFSQGPWGKGLAPLWGSAPTQVIEEQYQLSIALTLQHMVQHLVLMVPVVTWAMGIYTDHSCNRTTDPDMAISNNLGIMSPWPQVATQASQIGMDQAAAWS